MELDVITTYDCKFFSNSCRYFEYLIQWYIKKNDAFLKVLGVCYVKLDY